MTHESSLRGQRGEAAAHNYLSWFFARVLPTPPADPFDFICERLFTTKDTPQILFMYECTFRFQIKNHKAHHFPVKTSTLSRWLDDVEANPTFILYLEELGATNQKWRFLSMYDWFLRNAEHLPTHFGRNKISFRVFASDFEESGLDDACFHEALKTEAKRAARAQDAIWATNPHYSLHPLNLAQMLRFMELAGLEIPFAIAEQTSNQDLPRQMRKLLAGEPSGDNRLDHWWHDVHPNLPPVQLSNSLQRQQFKLFLTAMDNFRRGRPVQLPGPFRADVVSCWRNFVTMFPGSVDLLQSVVATYGQRSNRHHEILLATTLLPLVSVAGDTRLRSKGLDILRRTPPEIGLSTIRDLKSYEVISQWYRSLLEAGEVRYLGPTIDMVRRFPQWEIEQLRNYGWAPSQDVLWANYERKISQPTLRDLNTLQYHADSLEILQNYMRRSLARRRH